MERECRAACRSSEQPEDRVGDGPAHGGFRAVAGAGQQSAELFKGEAEREWGGEGIGRGCKRHLMAERIESGSRTPRNGTGGSEQGMVNHGESQQPRGMQAQSHSS